MALNLSVAFFAYSDILSLERVVSEADCCTTAKGPVLCFLEGRRYPVGSRGGPLCLIQQGKVVNMYLLSWGSRHQCRRFTCGVEQGLLLFWR